MATLAVLACVEAAVGVALVAQPFSSTVLWAEPAFSL